MGLKTKFYVFNENGLLKKEELRPFCSKLEIELGSEFKIRLKEEVNKSSPIYQKFLSKEAEVIIFNYGYVLKIEGRIKKSIEVLKIVCENLNLEKEIYVSPSQRIINSPEYLLSKGLSSNALASFLDGIFSNNNYSSSFEEE